MEPILDDNAWRMFDVPGAFDEQYPDLHTYDGYFWYRVGFDKPPKMTSDKINLSIGVVDDESTVWLNGKFMGTITTQTNPKDYWLVQREYDVSYDELHDKGNSLVVRVNDTYLNLNPAVKTTTKHAKSAKGIDHQDIAKHE